MRRIIAVGIRRRGLFEEVTAYVRRGKYRTPVIQGDCLPGDRKAIMDDIRAYDERYWELRKEQEKLANDRP